MADGDVNLDFLDAITNVNFGGAWLLITLNARESVVGSSSPPPGPSVSYSQLPKGVTLLDKQETPSLTSVDATFRNIYFIWINGPTFPTVDNYDVPAGYSTYAGQFGTAVSLTQSLPAAVDGSGFFSSMADANAVAAAVNAEIAAGWVGLPPGYTGNGVFTWTNPDGSTGYFIFYIPGDPYSYYAAQLDNIPENDAGASSILQGKYLFQVPGAKTTEPITVALAGQTKEVSFTAAIFTDVDGTPDINALDPNNADQTVTTSASDTHTFQVQTQSKGTGNGLVWVDDIAGSPSD